MTFFVLGCVFINRRWRCLEIFCQYNCLSIV